MGVYQDYRERPDLFIKCEACDTAPEMLFRLNDDGQTVTLVDVRDQGDSVFAIPQTVEGKTVIGVGEKALDDLVNM